MGIGLTNQALMGQNNALGQWIVTNSHKHSVALTFNLIDGEVFL